MSDWFKNLSDKVSNEFINPDSDLRSGRFIAKIKGSEEASIKAIEDAKNKAIEDIKQAATTQVSTTQVPIVCYRCGRPGHKSPYCLAKTHISGHKF